MHLQLSLVKRKTSKTLSSPFSLSNNSRTSTLEPLFIPTISIWGRHLSLDFNGLETSEDGSSNSEPECTLPPKTKRAPGRPRKRHIQTRMETSEDKPVRVQKCSRCRKSGHSVRTCKERI